MCFIHIEQNSCSFNACFNCIAELSFNSNTTYIQCQTGLGWWICWTSTFQISWKRCIIWIWCNTCSFPFDNDPIVHYFHSVMQGPHAWAIITAQLDEQCPHLCTEEKRSFLEVYALLLKPSKAIRYCCNHSNCQEPVNFHITWIFIWLTYLTTIVLLQRAITLTLQNLQHLDLDNHKNITLLQESHLHMNNWQMQHQVGITQIFIYRSSHLSRSLWKKF